MDNNNNVIVLQQWGDFFDCKFIDDLKNASYKENINLISQSNKGPFNCIEEITNNVALIISSTIFESYMCGIASSATIELVKSIIMRIYNHCNNKKLYKITAERVEEKEMTFGIQIGELNYRFPNNMSEGLKEKCIYQAFDLAKEYYCKPKLKKQIVRFNSENESWEICSEIDFINELAKQSSNN